MLIFLIGLPGSGKTTLGKQLAKKLDYVFSDLDESITSKYQTSIEDIFAQQGEETFRVYESECLKSYDKNSNTIVSTGGGAPCFFDNMKWINENGLSVFLNPPMTELVSRLGAANNHHRPMLKNLSEDDLLLFLKNKLADRGVFYNQSKIIIDKKNPSVYDVLEKIKAYK